LENGIDQLVERNSISKYRPEGSDLSSFDVSDLTSEAIKELRRALNSNPDDLQTRLLLMAYYQGGIGRRGNPDIYNRHLIWMIDNHPRHASHYLAYAPHNEEHQRLGRTCWMRQVRENPADVTVLVHAARYCSYSTQKDAVKFLLCADMLDPENEEIPRELFHVYALLCGHGSIKDNKSIARKAAHQMLEAVRRYRANSSLGSYLMKYFDMELCWAAEVALAHEALEEAVEMAQILLDRRSIDSIKFSADFLEKHNSMYEHSRSLGHSILGRAALASGDIETAKLNLRAMMALPIIRDSDQKLAEDLLAHKEYDVVTDFFEYNRTMWERGLEQARRDNHGPVESKLSSIKECENTIKWLKKRLNQIERLRRSSTATVVD
jgi:hypothetical protein